VSLIVREPDLTVNMSRYLAERIENESNIDLYLRSEVRELGGDNRLETVVMEDARTGDHLEVPARALFVFIGTAPRVQWLRQEVALDDKGFVLTGPHAGSDGRASDGTIPLLLETSRPGVFAAGDVRSGSVKRIAAAVGEGALAVRLIHQHLAFANGS
jgi:thioredoxin reductase (NADPH)